MQTGTPPRKLNISETPGEPGISGPAAGTVDLRPLTAYSARIPEVCHVFRSPPLAGIAPHQRVASVGAFCVWALPKFDLTPVRTHMRITLQLPAKDRVPCLKICQSA